MNQETKAGGKFTVGYVIKDKFGNIKEKGEESLKIGGRGRPMAVEDVDK